MRKVEMIRKGPSVEITTTETETLDDKGIAKRWEQLERAIEAYDLQLTEITRRREVAVAEFTQLKKFLGR